MTRLEPQITFHGMKASEPLEREVRERIEWLEQSYPALMSCRVRIDVPHRHHAHGRHLHVHIEMTAPGGQPILVTNEPSLLPALKDAREPAARKDSGIAAVHRYAPVAIREAFDIARRRLQDSAREQRGDIKAHQQPA